jgi:hypothetical protein
VEDLVKRAWIAHSPTAALYKPDLAVEIAQVLYAAATKIGIELKARGHAECPVPFEWMEYVGSNPTGTG